MSEVHAVMKVRLDMDTSREHRQPVIEEYIVPEYRELPGFLVASWMNDGEGTGLGPCRVRLRGTRPNGRAALTGPGGPEVTEWGIYSVEIEASV